MTPAERKQRERDILRGVTKVDDGKAVERPQARRRLEYGTPEYWAAWDRFDEQRRAEINREQARRDIPEGGWWPC